MLCSAAETMVNGERPTLQRIAERSGVSVSTISRVLTGQADRFRISKRTEARVRKLARECEFVPNQLARNLRLGKTQVIGLVVPDISNPCFASIARQVVIGAQKHGYSTVLCDSEDSTQLEKQSLGLLQGQCVAGIVLCPVGGSGKHLGSFAGGKLPIVVAGYSFPDLSLPYVTSDDMEGARKATEFLITNGHGRIACLQGSRGTAPNELRKQGYRQALARHGLPADESLIVGDSFTERTGYTETKLLLKTRPDVTAILALSNVNALGAIKALAEQKLTIPEDISLISFDDRPYPAYLASQLTTIVQSSAELGKVAIGLLFVQIRSGNGMTRTEITLPTHLIVRATVKRLETPALLKEFTASASGASAAGVHSNLPFFYHTQ